MLSRLNTRTGHYLLLLAVCTCTFLVNLGGASLWDVDEGRNTGCSYEMMQANRWLVPTFNGLLRVDKPALLYWLQISAFHFFGLNEFAARLPSALAGTATVLLVYELGRCLFSARTGLLAGLILASSVMMTLAARFANPDALLNCCSTLALFVCVRSLVLHQRVPFVWFNVAIGLGMLAKGPVGMVLPLTVLVGFLLLTRRLHLLFRPGLLLGAAVFVVVALPWYVLVTVETRASFLEGFFLTHNVGRFLSTMERHGGGPWYYPVVLLIGFAPWSVFLGPVLWCGFWPMFEKVRPRWQALWQAAREEPSPPGTELPVPNRYLFLWCWLAVYVLFFTVSATKLPNYVLPVVVPLAVLTGRFLERWARGELQLPMWVMHLSLACLVLVGALTLVGLGLATGLVPWQALRGRTLPGLVQLLPLGLVPILGALAGWLFWWWQARTRLVESVVVTAVVFVAALAIWGTQALNEVKPIRPLVEAAGAARPEDEVRIAALHLGHLPSLNFYCRRDVWYCSGENEVVMYLRMAVPVYAFLPLSSWEQIRAQVPATCRILGQRHDLISNRTFVVVCNR